MRTLLVLFVIATVGCESPGLSATWHEAEVVTPDPAPAIHFLFPLSLVRADVVNRADSAATFFLGGRNDGYGAVIGGGPDDPGRFLLVGPDTTLSMMAQVWRGRWERQRESSVETVAVGGTLSLLLLTDSGWLSPGHTGPKGWSPLASSVLADPASAVRFFERALRQGRIVYVRSGSPDTLVVERATGAAIDFRTSDRPTALN